MGRYKVKGTSSFEFTFNTDDYDQFSQQSGDALGDFISPTNIEDVKAFILDLLYDEGLFEHDEDPQVTSIELTPTQDQEKPSKE